MFNDDLTSAIAFFAGVAALIAYIRQRAKRGIKISGQALKLKKMPRAEEPIQGSGSLEEWNFPQPSSDSPKPTASHTTHPALTSAQALQSYEPIYQEIEQSTDLPDKRARPAGRMPNPRFGSPAKLREAMITMTVIGPCRALAPYQEQQ